MPLLFNYMKNEQLNPNIKAVESNTNSRPSANQLLPKSKGVTKSYISFTVKLDKSERGSKYKLYNIFYITDMQGKLNLRTIRRQEEY